MHPRHIIFISFFLFPLLATAQDNSAEKLTDKERAAKLSKACIDGDAATCSSLGRSMSKTERMEDRELVKITASLETACGTGDAKACFGYALHVAGGLGSKPELEKGARYMIKSCEGGFLRGCNSAGLYHQKGWGVSKDAARANALYQKACDGKNAEGCYLLARNLQEGIGGKQDHARSAKLYVFACDKGAMAKGCSGAGYVYLKGMGVKRDLTTAARYLDRGCELQDRDACIYAASIWMGEQGKLHDRAKAKVAASRACQLGGYPLCQATKDLDAKDWRPGREVYQSQCVLGCVAEARKDPEITEEEQMCTATCACTISFMETHPDFLGFHVTASEKVLEDPGYLPHISKCVGDKVR